MAPVLVVELELLEDILQQVELVVGEGLFVQLADLLDDVHVPLEDALGDVDDLELIVLRQCLAGGQLVVLLVLPLQLVLDVYACVAEGEEVGALAGELLRGQVLELWEQASVPVERGPHDFTACE